MTYQYQTQGTCSKAIEIETEGDTLKQIRFLGGCNGNTQGVASLVAGMKITDVISKLKGVNCNGRGTSCPDQLARALSQILEAEKAGN